MPFAQSAEQLRYIFYESCKQMTLQHVPLILTESNCVSFSKESAVVSAPNTAISYIFTYYGVACNHSSLLTIEPVAELSLGDLL
jgi:hypothetical protein